jgi:hypothetical protein
MNLLAKIMGDGDHPQIEGGASAHTGTSPQQSSSGAQITAESEADELQPQRTESSPQDARSMNEGSHNSGSIVAVVTQRQMPSRRQIAAAILENSKARARQLIGGETLDVTRPYSVFSHLEVKRIKIKHETGSVNVEVSETMCQEDGRILPARRMEREFTIFLRNDGVWVISDSREGTYLAEEQALEIFEHQAEIFLRRAPNGSNTRVVVKALDRLYDQQPSTPQQAAIR